MTLKKLIFMDTLCVSLHFLSFFIWYLIPSGDTNVVCNSFSEGDLGLKAVNNSLFMQKYLDL